MEETLKKVADFLEKKSKVKVSVVQEQLKLQEYEVYGLIEMLKQRGYAFEIVGDVIVKGLPVKENEVYQIQSKLDTIKLLLISDTHLASKYDRLDILRYLYAKAEDIGANYVLHSGDVTDGKSNRPQQIYELKETSYTGQRDYVVDKYPKSSVPTYLISGNHDLWWVQQCGADIVKDICSKRNDLRYLGSDCEDLKIGKLRIRMFHGKGGQAYAKSYKIQKYLDAIDVEERPHILQTGHTHQAFYLKQGKTHCFQTSCLQDLTPFERSMGFSNDKSCWWVTARMDDRGNPAEIEQKLETFETKRVRKRP